MNSEYDDLCQNIIGHIEKAKDNIDIIKEKAILEIHWGLGETLIEMGNPSEQDLKYLKIQINRELANDPLLRHGQTNTHWLELAALWVKEHRHQDKRILLSGKITWVQWALLLDVVKSAPQRYWLACQTIQQGWDAIALLRAAKSLPEEHLNG